MSGKKYPVLSTSLYFYTQITREIAKNELSVEAQANPTLLSVLEAAECLHQLIWHTLQGCYCPLIDIIAGQYDIGKDPVAATTTNTASSSIFDNDILGPSEAISNNESFEEELIQYMATP